MHIRPEIPDDIKSIRAIIAIAFAPMPYSNGTEPFIVDALRESGDLILSLVAEDEGQIVGQITFSPVKIEGENGVWLGLGPVSVLPQKQGRGIGGQLIKAGLDAIYSKGASGCVLIGNPDYYSRFGFVNKTGLTYGDLDTAYVQSLPFDGLSPKGHLKYCEAFESAAAG